MQVATFFRVRRGDRPFTEAAAETGINEGTLSRIERGEQYPKLRQVPRIVKFYDPDLFRIIYGERINKHWLVNLYPASVLRCLQLERNCDRCGKALPPESRANRKRHVKGGCS